MLQNLPGLATISYWSASEGQIKDSGKVESHWSASVGQIKDPGKVEIIDVPV